MGPGDRVIGPKGIYRVVQIKRSIRIFFTKSRILARLCSYFQTMVINMISKLCANFRMIAYFLRKPETLEWGSVKSAVNSWVLGFLLKVWNTKNDYLSKDSSERDKNNAFHPRFSKFIAAKVLVVENNVSQTILEKVVTISRFRFRALWRMHRIDQSDRRRATRATVEVRGFVLILWTRVTFACVLNILHSSNEWHEGAPNSCLSRTLG